MEENHSVESLILQFHNFKVENNIAKLKYSAARSIFQIVVELIQFGGKILTK
jgi:hypothetical protein